MVIKYDFIADDFDNSYKVFTTTDDGQHLLIGKFEFAGEKDFKWEMRFMQWICSHEVPREVSHG